MEQKLKINAKFKNMEKFRKLTEITATTTATGATTNSNEDHISTFIGGISGSAQHKADNGHSHDGEQSIVEHVCDLNALKFLRFDH